VAIGIFAALATVSAIRRGSRRRTTVEVEVEPPDVVLGA
jgi:hypothetical protein